MLHPESYASAFESWLDSLASPHTRRIYRHTWQLLLNHTHKHPWQLTRADLLSWVAAMHQARLRAVTIRLRLAAIRSFYRSHPQLAARNPASGIHISACASGRTLTPAEVQAFLAAIPTTTLNGRRDLALFLCILTSLAKPSHIRTLQLKQITRRTDRLYLTWRNKGRPWRELCHPHLQSALSLYLHLSGLHPSDGEAFVFTAWPSGLTARTPLSMTYVCRLARQYAQKAGLPFRVTVMTLRKTARQGRRYDSHR